jgi:SAM-dependent methyltransferase
MRVEDDRSRLAAELRFEYERRFSGSLDYRNRVWQVLTADFFQKYIPAGGTVLDLGCGYAQFINNIEAGKKYAMDLNPSAQELVQPDVTLFQQDCSQPWPIADGSLDVVFTSNFLEHLSDKDGVRKTLSEARRCLRTGGRIICMGPNVRLLPGAYWDFWDHHVHLSERSLSEILELCGFTVESAVDRFLPFTMVGKKESPLAFVRLYLRLPIAWKLFGKQFLVVARAK